MGAKNTIFIHLKQNNNLFPSSYFKSNHMITKLAVADPDLQIREGPGHPDPGIRGGGRQSPRKNFWPLGPQFSPTIRVGDTGPPRPLPWIHH